MRRTEELIKQIIDVLVEAGTSNLAIVKGAAGPEPKKTMTEKDDIKGVASVSNTVFVAFKDDASAEVRIFFPSTHLGGRWFVGSHRHGCRRLSWVKMA